MKKIAVALLLLFACSKSSTSPAPAQPPAPQHAAVPAVPAAAPSGEAKALLSDDKKVSAYLAYKKLMLPHDKLAVDMAMGGFKRGAKDGKSLGEEMKKDDRMAEFNKAHEAALVQSGLTQAELGMIMPPITSYGTQLYLAKKAEIENTEIAKKKEAGKLGFGEEAKVKINAKRLEKFTEEQAKFAEQYGQAAVDTIDKHAIELVELHDALMANVLGH